MSPRLQVRLLQEYCLRFALTEIHDRYQNGENKDLHEFLISTLHSGIRQQLIDLAFIEYRYNANMMIDVVGLLLDSSIRSMGLKLVDSYLLPGQCARLFSIMDRVEATGLHELKLQVNPRIRNSVVSNQLNIQNELSPLHRLLNNGLARNLHTLILRNACDNLVLAELGRASTSIKHLDISDNWLIDEVGISQLIFKDPNCVCLPADLDSCESWMLRDLNLIPDANLNNCCFTLQEVRIQDTNTSGMSLLMLLMFIKNLESLGGFLYYRNVGDYILQLRPYRNSLQLTKLWDMHLPWDKMQLIAAVTRQLRSLYTRVSQLPFRPLPFALLNDLTIDFDFVQYETRFVEFLTQNGANLKRLVLIDQALAIDITVIAKHCPLLTDLAAKICLENSFPKSGLPLLKTARLHMGSAETFRWIFINCPDLKRLEVQIEQEEEWEQANYGVLSNKVIAELAEMGLPSFDTIEHLHIFFMNDCVGRLDSSCIWTLVGACRNLRRLGDVQTWSSGLAPNPQARYSQFLAHRQQYLNAASELVEQNYDLDVRFKNISLTEFYSHHHIDTGILLAHVY